MARRLRPCDSQAFEFNVIVASTESCVQTTRVCCGGPTPRRVCVVPRRHDSAEACLIVVNGLGFEHRLRCVRGSAWVVELSRFAEVALDKLEHATPTSQRIHEKRVIVGPGQWDAFGCRIAVGDADTLSIPRIPQRLHGSQTTASIALKDTTIVAVWSRDDKVAGRDERNSLQRANHFGVACLRLGNVPNQQCLRPVPGHKPSEVVVDAVVNETEVHADRDAIFTFVSGHYGMGANEEAPARGGEHGAR
mmetsp:Transcript_6601/g.14521  ORF Transcript_6601/g.14521 Transcript_6601/m.14521 type:complete len:249 (+) Transcript_6601:3-749(+)